MNQETWFPPLAKKNHKVVELSEYNSRRKKLKIIEGILLDESCDCRFSDADEPIGQLCLRCELLEIVGD